MSITLTAGKRRFVRHASAYSGPTSASAATTPPPPYATSMGSHAAAAPWCLNTCSNSNSPSIASAAALTAADHFSKHEI